MKKILHLFLSIFIIFGAMFSISLAQENTGNVVTDKNGPSSWQLLAPTTMVDSIYGNIKKTQSNQVQKTEYDVITSKADLCGTSTDSRFTITRTLCNLRELSKDYLQYVVYIGLTAATILLIWNGFRIVTSDDREKEISTFKTNLKYIIIGVFLLIGFYYVIELFVTIVNLVTGTGS